MLAYTVRRLLWTPVLLVAVSLFVFVLGEFGPGDPVEVALGQNYTEERAERLREQRGLNSPVPVRYVKYIGNAITGDFGDSFVFTGRTVSGLLGPKPFSILPYPVRQQPEGPPDRSPLRRCCR